MKVLSLPPSDGNQRTVPQVDEVEMTARVRGILNRWPAVGLAIGVIRNGSLEFFHGYGLADIASNSPITEDTVFRIGSVTKTFTAIAVMQLWEQGLIDLDAPANAYLRAYKLIPAKTGYRPATVRHLLTHTAGIPEVVHASDLLHPDWGPFGSRPVLHSVRLGEPLPSLAEYYRGALRVVVEPGTAFAYTNHGFATLGQIVEDVSGRPLNESLREHIFEPLGMSDTDLVRSEWVRSRLATGYDLGPAGAEPITDRDWIGSGGGGAYSSCRDLARFVAALLGGGANEHGSILRPATVGLMFDPQYQPDPRLPGMGLAFARSEAGGHRVVGHDGILPGFNSTLLVAPDDGVGLVALTNGASGAMAWMPTELNGLLGQLIGASDDVIRTDLPHHPEIWGELCGRYQLPARVSDLRGRLMMGGGAEVFVRGGRLRIRLRTPFPALYRGLPLHPDNDRDPTAFRLDLSPFGMGIARIVFSDEEGAGAQAIHTDVGMLSFHRRRPAEHPWRGRALAAAVVCTTAIAAYRRRTTRRRRPVT